jgi:glycosyltransferase involved in cell wall biosynthesis
LQCLRAENTSARLKVTYLLTPITFGGAERVSLNFLGAVDRERFDIRPILLTRPWEEEGVFGRELRSLGYEYSAIPVAKRPKGDYLRIWRVINLIHSLCRKHPCDVIHTHGYFADICGLPVARMMGIRGISTCHGFIDGDSKLKLYNKIDKQTLKLCDRIIAVSEGIRGELVKNGIDGSRIEVIQNAVGPSADRDDFYWRSQKRQMFPGDSDEFIIGFVGRLSEEKGVGFLIEAAAALADEGARFKLVIVGDGPAKRDLEQLAKSRGLGTRTLFTGFQENIDSWLKSFDAFVLPSLTEGTPMAMLEAMAFALPVVATAVGGVPKVLKNGCNGLLVPAANVAALTRAMKKLWEDPGLRSELGREGRQTIRKDHDIETWARRIEGLYRTSGDLLPHAC